VPPAEGSKVKQSIDLKLPAGTLFPVAYEQALLASAEDGKSLFRRMVLDGASSVGLCGKSTIIGPRRLKGALDVLDELDRAFFGASSWPMSAAYFNMNRDLPNTEIFMQFFNSGVA